MVKKGLVEKIKDLDKRNLIRVSMTKKGLKVYYQTTKRRFIHNIMASLSDEEQQQFRSCLEKLRTKALKELGM